MTSVEALSRADEVGLDLVEVSENAKPPICRIMNYDKFRYEQSKKLAEAKKKQTVVEVKEIKFRPKTKSMILTLKSGILKNFLVKKIKLKLPCVFGAVK